jgi:hypothetical protein
MTMLRNREKVGNEFENDVHYAAICEHLANKTTTLANLHRQEPTSPVSVTVLNQLWALREIRKRSTPICPSPATPFKTLNRQDQCPEKGKLQNNPNPSRTARKRKIRVNPGPSVANK